MTEKTLADFFGGNSSTNEGQLSVDLFEIMSQASENEPFFGDINALTPEQIASAFIAIWFKNNYTDEESGVRLSTDKTAAFVANSNTIRRSIITRGDEAQVKHDFSFSIYTKDQSEFSPNKLIGSENQEQQYPEPQT